MDVVTVCRCPSKGRNSHRDDAICDVCEIQVKSILHIPANGACHGRPRLRVVALVKPGIEQLLDQK